MKKLILFELRKVFSKRLALIALIGIILFSALLSFSTFQNKYAFDPNIGEGTGKTAVEIDKEIAAKYEGKQFFLTLGGCVRVLVFPCGLKLLGKLILVFNNFFCHRFDCIENSGFNG